MEDRTGKPTGIRGIQRLTPDRAGRPRWRVRVKYKCPITGAYKDVEKRVRVASLKEANRFRVDWIRQLETPPDPAKTASTLTLGTLIERYIKDKQGEWKPATRINTESILRTLDKLNQSAVAEIKREHLIQVLQSRKLAPRSWNVYRNTYFGLFDWAKTENLVLSNPAESIQHKKKGAVYSSKNPGHLTNDQIPAFLDWFRTHRPQYYPIVLVGLTSGIRSGSLRVLLREDLKGGLIKVNKGLSKNELVEGTKTSPEEIIPILPKIEAFLEQWWKALPEWRKTKGYLFPSESGGVMKGTTIQKQLDDCCEALGLPRLKVHGLRRTAAHLLRQTTDLKTAKTITGHSGDAMFLHYSEPEQRERAEAVRRAFGGLLEGLDHNPEG